jgi:hypothetical protein
MKRSLGIFILLVVGIGIIFGIRNVYATINNDLPAAADVEAGGKNGFIELHLKKLAVAQVVRNKMSAYYPTWDTSSNGKTITIESGRMGRVCNVDEPSVSGKIRITITVADNSVDHDIPIDQVCDTNNFYSKTFAFPNGTLKNDPGISKTRADIVVWYDVSPQLPASSGSDLNYEMHLTGNNSGNGLLALQSNNKFDEFGLRSSYSNNPAAADNNDIRFREPFGYPCSTTFSASDSTNREVKLYDADSVFGDTYMWIEKNDSKIDLGQYGSERRRIDSWDGGQKRWKLSGSNDDFNMLTLNQDNVEVGAKYELVIFNNGNGGTLNPHYNTLSVGIPQDSIYSRGNCEYKLVPNIDIDTDSYVYYPSIRVTGSITEDPAFNGPIPEAHPWEMYAVRYSGEPATRNLVNGSQPDGDPCSNGILPAGRVPGAAGCLQISPPLNYTANPSHAVNRYTGGGPDPVGTRLCFFTRVKNPTHLIPDNDQWVYSDMRCSVSLKKPRVQFLGSDLRVGGNATSSYYNVRGNNYGSWVEYGAFTLGNNSLVSSGNGLRNSNPSPATEWNKLTFANTPSPPYGNYGQVPIASSAYAYFRGIAASGGSLNQAAPTSGVYDFAAADVMGGMTVNANATSVIVRKVGTLRISGNVTVANNGVTDAGNLSQVVLVADNIIIDPGVTRIDAWLVTSPVGYINTCNGATLPLTSAMCPNLLEVNGAIYTGAIRMLRTAGGNPPEASIKEPAERFNLRPDAQLWAYSYANKADYAQTDFIQELPPRY